MGKAKSADAVWHIRIVDPQGKERKSKASTAQIVQWIKEKKLDERAEATQDLKQGYRKLATYKEFEPHLRSQITEKKVQRLAGKAGQEKAKLLANYDQEEARHKRKKMLRALAFNIGAILFFLLVVGGGVAAYFHYFQAAP